MVDECNLVTSTADPRFLIDQPSPLRLQVFEGSVDVRDGECDVVHARSFRRQELTDRRIGTEWLEELDVGAPHRDHRLFDTLLLDDLPAQRLDRVLVGKASNGVVEVGYSDGDVMDVVGQHEEQAT